MAINIAISGFGRIGRLVLRAIYEQDYKDIKVVAINCSRGDIEKHAHLLRYDSQHGRFNVDVKTTDDSFVVNGDRIRYFNTRDPNELSWGELEVDLVMECTGAFRGKESCQFHLDNGAKKVLISAPGEKDVDATIVYGVNHSQIKKEHTGRDNARGTTNRCE